MFSSVIPRAADAFLAASDRSSYSSAERLYRMPLAVPAAIWRHVGIFLKDLALRCTVTLLTTACPERCATVAPYTASICCPIAFVGRPQADAIRDLSRGGQHYTSRKGPPSRIWAAEPV